MADQLDDFTMQSQLLGGTKFGDTKTTQTPPQTTPAAQPAPTQPTQFAGYGKGAGPIGVSASGGMGAMGQTSPVFNDMVRSMEARLKTNNDLVKQKNLVYTQMYDRPLTGDEKKALSPSLARAMESGDRNLIATEVRAINDQIKGRSNTIDTAISDFMSAKQQMLNNQMQVTDKFANYKASGLYSNAQLSEMAVANGFNPRDLGVNDAVGDAIHLNVTSGSPMNDPQTIRDEGQCGAFVNDYLGDRIFGDTYEQKMSLANSKTPQAGAVAIIPTGQREGHVAVVESINADGSLNIVESNWSGTGVVTRRTIDPRSVGGFYVPPQGAKGKFSVAKMGGGQVGGEAQSFVSSLIDQVKNKKMTIPSALAQIDKLKLPADQAKSLKQKVMDESTAGGGEATKKEAAKVMKLEEKKTAYEDLKSHPGLEDAVGPFGIARSMFMGPDRISFIADVENLVQQETLDKLVAIKGEGATLGALSDSERAMLEKSASKISSWRITEKDSDTGELKTIGYKVDEATFRKELDRLKKNTEGQIEQAGGKLDIQEMKPQTVDTFEDFYSNEPSGSDFNWAEQEAQRFQ